VRYEQSMLDMYNHFNITRKQKLKCHHFKILNKYDYKEEQAKDEHIREIISEIVNSNSKETTFKHRQFVIINGVLYKKSFNPHKNNRRIVLPKHLHNEIMSALHDPPLSGHLGRNKTLNRINSRFYWDKMKDDIFEYVDSCIKCQTIKRKPNRRAQLQHIKASKPFQILGIDVSGPFTTTNAGNTYIITAICYFSKFCISKAIKDFTATTTAKFIFEEIICKYGVPEQILTDQGRNFEAELIKHLCLFLGVDKLRTTSYHAKANGEVERFNKTLKTMLATYVNNHHRDWDIFLQQVVFAYNTSTQESTRLSPFKIVFGHDDTQLIDLKQSYQHEKEITPNSYVDLLIKTQKETNKLVEQNITKAHQKQDKNYSVSNKKQYKRSDLVLLNNETMKVGQTKKFVEKYKGPFQIEAIQENNYRIRNVANGKIQYVHYDRLQPYNQRKSIQPAKFSSPSPSLTKTIPPLMSLALPRYNLRSNKNPPPA
jgi:hypothetical protein